MSRTDIVRDMRRLLVCREGASAIEYAVIASMVSIAIATVVDQIGSGLANSLYASVAAMFGP